MGNSIYCAATQIQVVDAKLSGKTLKIEDFQSRPLPEGVLINGVITDEDTMITTLKEMVAEKCITSKAVSLVVDSSNIMMRTLNAPILSRKGVQDFVKQELSAYQEDGAQIVYDYAVLEPKLATGGGSILAVAVQRSFLESYLQVFRAAGLVLEKIDLGINAQVKLVAHLPCLQQETFILAQVDGNNLVMTLFDKGKYILANRYRLLYTFGSMGWYEEFDDHLSSMIQFNKGQKSNDEIACVYVDGLSAPGQAAVAVSLASFNIELKTFPEDAALQLVGKAQEKGGFSLGKYQYAVGNLLKR